MNRFRKLLFLALAAASPLHLLAEESEYPVVIHEDEFEGKTLENPWGSWKSASVVRDGVMVGITPGGSDHPSVNQITFEAKADLEVTLSFKFAGSEWFSVMFREPEYKGSHAGHICDVQVSPKYLMLQDGKAGRFRADISEARKAGKKPAEDIAKLLESKRARGPLDLDPEEWHTLKIQISGDTLTAWVDGEKATPLVSGGIAHPTKTNMNLTTNGREVHYDHFSLRAK